MPAQYTQRICRQYPGLFVILLDQSSSMEDPVTDMGCNKAEFATATLNALIYEMTQLAGYLGAGKLKKSAYLSLLGYNSQAYSLLPYEIVDLPYLDENPLAHAPLSVDAYDKVTHSYQSKTINDHPIWVVPNCKGRTHMAEAFVKALKIVDRWFHSEPERGQAPRSESFPPIIINITDAEDNGPSNPVEIAQAIMKMSTNQGNVLIFNCHFTTEMRQPCIFPTREEDIKNLGSHALDMFFMSSVIPSPLREEATDIMPPGQKILYGARSFVYNSNADTLIKFLRWGTIRRTGQ